MKRWGEQHRNIIIVCVLFLSLIALMIVTLKQNKSEDHLPASQPATPSPNAATPNVSVTPSNESADSELFQLVQDNKYKYFRVSEGNQYWDYEPGESIWFSQGDAQFMLSLDIPNPSRLSSQQLEMLRNNIAITTTAGEPVSFTVMEGSIEQQLVISLKGTPNSDLTLSFYSQDQAETKEVKIYYMKPFEYKLTSEKLPLLDKAFKVSKERMELPLPVSVNLPYTITFEFTDEVDRDSVNKHFKQTLTEANWSVDWVDNRTFKLTLSFDHQPSTPMIRLSASGIRNARGVELKSLNYVSLEPTRIQGYAIYDLATNTQSPLLTTNNLYETIMPSPNDMWLLTSTAIHTPRRTEYLYELLDRKGNVIQTFDHNELVMPMWSATGDRIVYVNGKSGNRELVQYNNENDTNELIWQVPDSSSQIIAFDIEPKQGNIAIAWGKFNSTNTMDIQLETLSGINNQTSKRFANIGKVSCYEASCSFQLKWMNENTLLYHINEDSMILIPESGQSRALNNATNQTKRPTIIETIQYRGKTWSISMSEENGNEYWIWSDGEQDISFTTSINMAEQSGIMKGPYPFGLTALLFAEGKGWYRIDPGAKTARLTNEVPDWWNPELIIGQYKEKLIIGLDK